MDCGFSNEKYWFRYRACAIIIKDDCVLMAKNNREPYFYSVGGGVKVGESSQDAVKREVLEETGFDLPVIKLAFIHENIFQGEYEEKGKTMHEIAFYYFMDTNNIEKNNYNKSTLVESGVIESIHWIKINEIKNLFAFPQWFATQINIIQDKIVHILSVDDKIVSIG